MPTVLGSTSLATANNTPAVPTPPVVDGATLILVSGVRGGSTIPTAPTGWTPDAAAATGTSSTSTRGSTYRRLVPTASSEPATHTVTYSPAANPTGVLFAVSLDDADPDIPIHKIQWATGADDDTVTCPEVTTEVDGCLILRAVYMNRSAAYAGGLWTPPGGGSTKLQDPARGGTSSVCGAIGWANQASAGPTGTEAWTITADAAGARQTLALTVAVAPPVLTADAGPDQTVDPGQRVALDGSGSNNATSYLWAPLTGSPTPILQNANQVIATFDAPTGAGGVVNTITLRLTTGDGVGTATDDVTVNVNALPPDPPITRRIRRIGAWVPAP